MAPEESDIAATSVAMDGCGLVGLVTPDIVNLIKALALKNPLSLTDRTCPLDIEASPLITEVEGDKKVKEEDEAHDNPAPDNETTNVL